MAETHTELTEREELELAVEICRDWTVQRTCSDIEDVFFRLSTFDQNENVDLWKQLRETIVGNKALLDSDLQYYIYEPVLAKNGWWWYDRNQWAVNSEQ